MTIGPSNTQSSYLPPEQDFPEDSKLLREILADRERKTANVLNIKENAQYEKNEMLTGQQWFSQAVSGSIQTSYTSRLAFDLVALNGGSIPNGTTTLTLTASTQPAAINVPTAIQFVHGFGAATDGTTVYFVNDPKVVVNANTWTNSSQEIIITNTTGNNLTQFVWVMEYIKT